MTVWMKALDGKTIQLKDSTWRAKIYASGEACDDPKYLESRVSSYGLIHSTKYAYKKADFFTRESSRVLEIELEDAHKIKKLAEVLEETFQNSNSLKLYNVDLLPEQQYFYEKDLFPLAYVEIDADQDGEIKRWDVLDSVSSYNYETPKLKTLRLAIEISDLVPRMDSTLVSVSLYSPKNDGGDSGENDEGEREIAKIERQSEEEVLCEAAEEIGKFDPDLVITQNGDSFVLPFLYSKANKYSVDLSSKLNRDNFAAARERSGSRGGGGGRTYFSYGRILYRPNTQRLFGRLHLDEQNTFVYDQCMFEGLFEVSRLCRIPIHTSMRASIGKCLSSLQFYYAAKDDILIPWKPDVAEDFKNGYELFNADRGGFVLKPLAGVHEHIGELDFASLYPSIIRKYNISAETVNCSCSCSSCCFPSNGSLSTTTTAKKHHHIEELGMNVCGEHEGIVSRSLALPLNKRFEYKRLRDQTSDKLKKKIYNERAGSLKWILVCSFGYLSYRNAKFGKIDSHIAVCALARKTLLDAMRNSEYNGFRVVHGIVDSLWLSKENATKFDYEKLGEEIERNTKFKIAVEGIYKWIVFLPSKTYSGKQVANRYFGAFEETNELKVRGIELRRHDSPLYFKKCQAEILDELVKCNNEIELRHCARWKCARIFEKYAQDLERHKVSPTQLIITRRLSKNINEYSSPRQLSVNAASHLARQGLTLQAGQSVSYVVTRYNSSGINRSLPEELLKQKCGTEEGEEYDSQRYIELLADCCATVLHPLGVTKEELLTRSQSLISWNN
jgi:DNA polymerase elongation subunit (family B)